MGLTDALDTDPTLMAMARPLVERTLDPPVLQEQPEDATARVRRLYNRFLSCWSHPLWTRWRKEAKEDIDFQSGAGQWKTEDRAVLESKGRACLTINQIRPVVAILTGYERASRLEMKTVPTGTEDLQDVTVLGRILKRVETDQEVPFILSEGFKEGVIGGLATWYIGVDYGNDPIHGEPIVIKTRVGEVVWDPDWTRYDLSDARDVFWHKIVPVDELVAQYPEKQDAIRQALDARRVGDAEGQPIYVPFHDPADAYRTGADMLPLYDPMRDEVLVLEAWQRTWETVSLLVDRVSARVEAMPEGDPGIELARALARLEPDRYRVAEQRRRRMVMSVILPATLTELEQGNPFENDTQDYPFIPFLVFREGEEIQGIVRNLKDPQREVNKRRSALTDNVVRHGNVKWFATRNALENVEFFHATPLAGDVGWLKNPNVIPKEVTPPQMPQWIVHMDGLAKNDIREISTINADLLGFRDPDASGIAIARRQQQGQISATEIFDNFKRSRRLVGRRLVKRIQQTYTGEMTIRLDATSGPSEFVTINQRTVDPGTGRITVVRDIPSLRFDVDIVDSPATPSARAAALATLMELADKVPIIAPAIVDIIVELTDIPDRERVLARIRQVMEQAQAQQALASQQPRSGGPSPYKPVGQPAVTGATPLRQRTGAPNTAVARAGMAPPGGV